MRVSVSLFLAAFELLCACVASQALQYARGVFDLLQHRGDIVPVAVPVFLFSARNVRLVLLERNGEVQFTTLAPWETAWKAIVGLIATDSSVFMTGKLTVTVLNFCWC